MQPSLPRQVSLAIAHEFQKVHGVAPPSEAEAVSFLKQMLDAPASDAGRRLSRILGSPPSSASAAAAAAAAAAAGFEAPRTVGGPLPLPPAVQLAVQHEFAARFGAAPKDATASPEVMSLFGKSLLAEYAANDRSFKSLAEAASFSGEHGGASGAPPAGFPACASLRKGSSQYTSYSAAAISNAPSGLATPLDSKRSSTSRASLSVAVKAGRWLASPAAGPRISGCRPTMSALPTGLDMMAGFQTTSDPGTPLGPLHLP